MYKTNEFNRIKPRVDSACGPDHVTFCQARGAQVAKLSNMLAKVDTQVDTEVVAVGDVLEFFDVSESEADELRAL